MLEPVQEKSTITEAGVHTYPIHEHFYTLQGEGDHSGKAAYFIRLAGCDVGCHWCDVKESWGISEQQYMSTDELLKLAASQPARLAVITGGEPASHDLGPITSKLKDHGFQVHIETSGVYELTGQLDWITLSPKKFKPCLPENFTKANELKIVIFHPKDLEWAENLAQNVRKDCKLYLQPEWSKSKVITPLIIEYIQKNPKWRFSLQTHKYMNIP